MTQLPDLARLRALLRDAAAGPAELTEALRAERDRVAGADPVAHELLVDDLRWLARQPEVQVGELAEACELARREWLDLRERALSQAAGEGASAVFELADVRGEARLVGMRELEERCDRTIDELVRGVVAGPALLEEANERFAVLMASVEDPSLARQVALLRSNAEAMGLVADRTTNKPLRKLARRLGRAADDRELALRLERRLGHVGVTVFEALNFGLLVVVLTILTVEFTVDVSASTANVLHWIDALSCSFFIVAFFFEFALHPRRWSWFARNFVTDLLPAIPSVLFLMPATNVPGAVEDAVVIRVLRVLRVSWAARYLKLLRSVLRSMRFILFLVRGMDSLVQRFAPVLDREFVFVPAAKDVAVAITEDERRDLLFAAVERERELLSTLESEARLAALRLRVEGVGERARALGPAESGSLRLLPSRHEVPIDRAVEVLWSLRPQDLSKWLDSGDVTALDRVVRIFSAVPVRWLPLVRRFAVHPLPATAEERIVASAHRAADWVERWHSRLLFHADLHGIVTGPQILDRVATALIKATQRPTVRLLLFGGLFLVVNKLFGLELEFVNRVLGVPLIVLGSIGFVGFALGRWMKSVAGEAADAYRLTSEAHFLPQLELWKCRHEDVDLEFLARRVFDGRDAEQRALQILRQQIRSAQVGVPVEGCEASPRLRLAANRVGLFYLHYLDGAPLHITDVKTTEQLLANKALENLREKFLNLDRRDRKRLRKLRLDEGSLVGGPYLWFSFITESVAVEAAKRIEGYNRYCIPRTELVHVSEERRAAMTAWLERRCDPRGGRTLAADDAIHVESCATTEFTAIDFVGADSERDRHIGAIFGEEVVHALRIDRRTMIREIFGTRPVHHLPKHERSFNPLRLYRSRMANGRILLAPLMLVLRFFRLLGWVIARIRQIVREVLAPVAAKKQRRPGAAPFAVALRKIHRMKAPGLLEAMRTRLRIDPVYSGAPCGWSGGEGFQQEPELERDVAFLHLRERESVGMRDGADVIRRQVRELHAALAALPAFPEVAGSEERHRGEFAVTCAWITDRADVRTLLSAERWRERSLQPMLEEGVEGSWLADFRRRLQSLFRVSPVDSWLQRHGRDLPKEARRTLHRAWAEDRDDIRRVLTAWNRLEADQSPVEVAIGRLHEIYLRGPAVHRDVLALRAVQALAVLDVRNYRDIVFELGGYADEGEERERWCTLP